jgi:hypothetical protein
LAALLLANYGDGFVHLSHYFFFTSLLPFRGAFFCLKIPEKIETVFNYLHQKTLFPGYFIPPNPEAASQLLATSHTLTSASPDRDG